MSTPRIRWPNGARCAVLISFDVDGPAVWIEGDPEAWNRPRTFSLGTYGPLRGVPRVLDLLDEVQVPASFYVPGWVAENWPAQFGEIGRSGHEIGHHGYLHEVYAHRSLDEFESIVTRAQEAFVAGGAAPAVGFRSPGGDFKDGNHRILERLGFEYSSSMRGDDRPYRWVVDGRTTDLIEICAHWELDDFPYWGFNDEPADPSSQDRIAGLDWVYDNWRREFDGYYAEGLCFTLMMHPQVIGKPGRVALLRRLIRYMQQHEGVWFATAEQIADWWRENY